jgi:hypothetical protein
MFLSHAPARVLVHEVAVRDGFQSEPRFEVMRRVERVPGVVVARELPALLGHDLPGQVVRAGKRTALHPAPVAERGLEAH